MFHNLMQMIVQYTVGYKQCHCYKYLGNTNSGSYVCAIVTMTNCNSDNNGLFLIEPLQLPTVNVLKYGVLTREHPYMVLRAFAYS